MRQNTMVVGTSGPGLYRCYVRVCVAAGRMRASIYSGARATNTSHASRRENPREIPEIPPKLYTLRQLSIVYFRLLADNMPGYSVLDSQLKGTTENVAKYRCPQCRLLLRDAVQPSCGHWLCTDCAVEIFARK